MQVLLARKYHINTDIGIRLVGFRNHILKSKKGTGHLIPSPVINNSL